MDRPFYADSMGFVAPPGKPPVADPNLKLDLVHLTSAPPFNPEDPSALLTTEEILHAHRVFREVVEGQKDRFIIVRDLNDISAKNLEANHQTRVILGLQAPADDLIDRKYTLRLLQVDGIRVMALAYSGLNRYGSGFLDPYGPLTEDGKKLIKMIAEAGMILDLSHAGHQTAWDALVYIESTLSLVRPLSVMASHGGCYGAMGCYNPRNLPDEVLKKIALMDGVVGVYTLTFGLDPSDNGPRPFRVHLRNAISVCGTDHVVLGTDGVHKAQGIDEWQAHHKWMMENVPNAKEMRARWPDQSPIFNCPERMETIESMLVGRGFTCEEIEKVMGKNFLEFLRRSL